MSMTKFIVRRKQPFLIIAEILESTGLSYGQNKAGEGLSSESSIYSIGDCVDFKVKFASVFKRYWQGMIYSRNLDAACQPLSVSDYNLLDVIDLFCQAGRLMAFFRVMFLNT